MTDTKALSPANPTFLSRPSRQGWRPGGLCARLFLLPLRRLREASGYLFPTCQARGPPAWPLPGGARPPPGGGGAQGFAGGAERNLPARSSGVAVSCAAAAASPAAGPPPPPQPRPGPHFAEAGSWPEARGWGWGRGGGRGRAPGRGALGRRLCVCVCVCLCARRPALSPRPGTICREDIRVAGWRRRSGLTPTSRSID